MCVFGLTRTLLDGSLLVTVDEVRSGVRLLAEQSPVIAQGAGTAALAALSGRAGTGTLACIISGDDLDLRVLIEILAS